MKDFRDMDGKFNMIEEEIIDEDPFPVKAKTYFIIKEQVFCHVEAEGQNFPKLFLFVLIVLNSVLI